MVGKGKKKKDKTEYNQRFFKKEGKKKDGDDYTSIKINIESKSSNIYNFSVKDQDFLKGQH